MRLMIRLFYKIKICFVLLINQLMNKKAILILNNNPKRKKMISKFKTKELNQLVQSLIKSHLTMNLKNLNCKLIKNFK